MPRTLANPITYYALATLFPVPLLIAATYLGGGWIGLSLLSLTLFPFVMDEWTSLRLPSAQNTDQAPTAEHLSTALVATQFLLLPLALMAFSGATGLGWGAAFGLLLAYALYFGQVSMANAHELIHRDNRRLVRLGIAAHIAFLFGHHVSAHRHVHHRFAATGEDPYTADLDEGFYPFAERAWIGGFRAGYEMEQALAGKGQAARAESGKTPVGKPLAGQAQSGRMQGRIRRNPYVIYAAGAIGGLGLTLAFFGFAGLIGYILLAALVQGQILLAEYVQHYGLLRRRLPGGKVELMGPEHAWNANQGFSALMTLNLGRHSDHHISQRKEFPDLRLPIAQSAPMLPYSLPVMSLIALYPPFWRQVMTPRAKAWRNAPLRPAPAQPAKAATRA